MTRLAATLLIALTSPASAQDLCICLKCLIGAYRHFEIQSGSMSPALEPGTCITLKLQSDIIPEPGQIIGFTPTDREIVFVFRAIAIPGQTVQLQNGRLLINGAPIPQTRIEDYAQIFSRGPTGIFPRCPTPTAEGETCLIPRFTETLPNGVSYDVLDIEQDGNGDNTDVFAVPEGYVFVLGDNRDNANDSRYALVAGGMGFVPVSGIVGTFDEILSP